MGAGNIARAIIGGLMSKKLVPSEDIAVFDADVEKYECDIMRSVNCCSSLDEALSGAQLVVLALDPSVIGASAGQIASCCEDFADKTYISVAAGVSSGFICASMGRNVPVICTMPNTPLFSGQGAVAVSRNSLVSEKIFRYVCRIFSSMAVIAVLDESLMNAVISINGSSPACVYLLYKAMLEGAISQGISEDKARALILQSLKGAVAMLEHSGKNVDALIKDVPSPDGTALAALSVLNDADFIGTVGKAMTACTRCVLEMAAEVESVL